MVEIIDLCPVTENGRLVYAPAPLSIDPWGSRIAVLVVLALFAALVVFQDHQRRTPN